MALASKVNIFPLALLLPAAFALRYLGASRKPQATEETIVDDQPLASRQPLNTNYWLLIATGLLGGALASFISFRIFQPYAFDGLGLNPQWVANIKEQRLQATGNADVPWICNGAAHTSVFIHERNLWGLGLPLGILAWAGFFIWVSILKGEWRHALLWGWTAIYFVWQSLQFNPTMRYQLPIYPLLVMMAAWFVFELARLDVQPFKRLNFSRILAGVLGISVVLLTAMWAFAFHSIYTRDEPRIAASRWIYRPGDARSRQIRNLSSLYVQTRNIAG
jgi:hypothetical protein